MPRPKRGKAQDAVPRWARPGFVRELQMEGHLMGGEFPDLNELKAIHDALYVDDGFGGGGWDSDDDNFDDFGSGFFDGIGPRRQFRRPPWEPNPKNMTSDEFEQLQKDIKGKDPRCNMEVPSLKETNSTLLDRVKEELTGEEFSKLNKTKIYNTAKEYLKSLKKMMRRDFVVQVVYWTEDLGLMREDEQSDGDIAQFLLLKVYSEVLTLEEFIYLDVTHVDGIVDKTWEGIKVPELYSVLFNSVCDAHVLRAKSIAKEDVRPDFDPELHVGVSHRIPIDVSLDEPIKFCKGPCQICGPKVAAWQRGEGKGDAHEEAGSAKKQKLNASAPAFTPGSASQGV